MTVFKLCPAEPDEEMIGKGWRRFDKFATPQNRTCNMYRAMTADCKIVKVKCPLDFKVEPIDVSPFEMESALGWNLCLRHLKASGYKILREIV